MFELEVGTNVLAADELPASVREALAGTRASLNALSITPWEEHCTECAMPMCYATCDLYSMRADGKCRRFVQGIETIPVSGHPQGYVAKVAFKRWGVLMAYTESIVYPIEDVIGIEGQSRRVERLAAAFPGSFVSIQGRRGIPMRLARRWKQRASKPDATEASLSPDGFFAEIINPTQQVIRLSMTIRSVTAPERLPYQKLLELSPGYNEVRIPIAEISRLIALDESLQVLLTPNVLTAEQEGLTLYFGLLAFVRYNAPAIPTQTDATIGKSKVKHIKVAVWDLDNTMWTGTLIEDGLAGVTLRPEAAERVRDFDKRGIVNSVLSKNHEDDALAALKHFGLSELFVFPKIGWGEKGQYMRDLIREFNVDANTFAFIDDQPFEREQVQSTNPAVRVYDAADVATLGSLPEFNPPVSLESASRRQFYRTEETRVKASQHFGGEYLEFLRSCGMQASIRPVDAASMDRVQELVQRTNQLNYSGTHYSREEISALLADPSHEGYLVACRDNFGEYGTVGFVLVNVDRPMIRDAMFSCRIQFKRVEHAMLRFLLDRYRAKGAPSLFARFCKTKKNAAAVSVFHDMGFTVVSSDGDETTFEFALSAPIVDDGIISVTYNDSAWIPSVR